MTLPEEDRPRIYSVGAAAAGLAVALGLVQSAIEAYGVAVAKIAVPWTVEEWFALIQRNRILAFTELTGLQIPMFALLVPVFLAVHRALRSALPPWPTVGAAFALIGIAVYLASNTAFAMVSLGDRYAAAVSDADRSHLLGAGEAMFAMYQGVGLGAGVALVLMAALILSAVMLRERTFGRAVPYLGIAVGLIALGYYAGFAIPADPLIVLEFAAVLFLVWVALVGWRLYRLAQPYEDEDPIPA